MTKGNSFKINSDFVNPSIAANCPSNYNTNKEFTNFVENKLSKSKFAKKNTFPLSLTV
jgi:hypothetical protein